MAVKSLITFALTITISFPGLSQVFLKDVKSDLLKEAKVEEYIQNQIENNTLSFEDIEPSLEPSSEVTGFRRNNKKYRIKHDLEQVWLNYVNTPQREAWSCNRISYSLLFSKNSKKLFYANQKAEKLDSGQVIYLNLKFLNGLYKLPVAFEITSVDPENKLIEFSYIKGNMSEGKQQIHFFETKNGFTRIEHNSYYRSKSLLRDLFLYPYFHARITNDFHRNMKEKIMAKVN